MFVTEGQAVFTLLFLVLLMFLNCTRTGGEGKRMETQSRRECPVQAKLKRLLGKPSMRLSGGKNDAYITQQYRVSGKSGH
jgi:hypothetical protein